MLEHKRSEGRRGAWARVTAVACMLVGGALATAVLAQKPVAPSPDDPSEPWVVGGQTLHVGARAVRKLASRPVYAVTFDVPRLIGSETAAQGSTLPKAFRVDILPGAAEAPEGWREELLPALAEADDAALRRAYADLRPGDRLYVVYAPQEGTTVSIDHRVVLRRPGPEVIDAYLALWFDDHPIASQLRLSLTEPDPPSR